MSTSLTATLSRQMGLLREMDVIANNIANISTTGFRERGLVFSEFIKSDPVERSVSMGHGNTRSLNEVPGTLSQTGNATDFAITGDGYFLIEAPDGQRLTRAGHFTTSADGILVTQDGHPVLDAGEAPIFVPQNGGELSAASDGTLSVDGNPFAQLGLFTPAEPLDLRADRSTLFDPGGPVIPVEGTSISQGFLESSNVNPMGQIARMIEVQRAYEIGQNFLNAEDERIRKAINTLTR